MNATDIRRSGLLTAAVSMALATGAAHAQEGAPTLDDVVVTGSRLATSPLDAPQPVLAVTAEDLAVRGVTSTGDALETVPALIASLNVDQTARDSALAGRATLNLRNMGTARTLVLVNGRRHVAGVPGSAAVDISTIPSSLIERIDVLTGGASAVYGSDAVTGVVNFVTKRDFVGTELEAQAGSSFAGDAARYYMSALHGLSFADGRGNLALAVQGEKRDELYFGDRAQLRDNGLWTRDQNPALRFQAGDPLPTGVSGNTALGQTILRSGLPRYANTPQSLIDRARSAPARAYSGNQVFSGSAVMGLVGIDTTRFGFADPARFLSTTAARGDCNASFNGRQGFGCWVVDPVSGQVRTFRDGTYLGTFNQQGGDGAAQTFNTQSVTPETTQVAVNLLTSFEFNEAARVYGEFKYVDSRGKEWNPYNSFDDSIPIALDNPYIPAALRNLINAEIATDPALASTAQFVVSRDNIDVFDPLLENERKTYRGVVGIEGEVFGGWRYDVSLNYGRTDSDFTTATRMEDRFFSAVDAVRDPVTGNPTCRINLDPNSRAPISALTPGWETETQPRLTSIDTFDPRSRSCIPLNVFGLNTVNPGQNAFLNYYATDTAKIEQEVALATLTGDSKAWFELPGGPIGIAVGAEYRKETSDFRADPFTRAGYQFQFAADSDTAGEYDVTEGFVELQFPLLANVPFARLLTLDAAYRYGNYSTSGSADSWKVGLVWAPIEDLRLRGGYSKTLRAPNISELFTPETASTFRPVDPCDQANVTSGPSPTNRAANCRADGIPAGFTDPLTARFTGVVAGNPDLLPEESTSWTAGVVLRPRFLEGFAATIDYWSIDLTDAISAISAQNIVDSCYDAASLNNQFCALFSRNRNAASPTFLGFNFLRQLDVNFARQIVTGVDFDFGYTFERGDLGLLRAGVNGSYLQRRDNYEFFGEPDRRNPEKQELNNPEWVLNVSLNWSYDAVSVSWNSTYWDRTLFRDVEFEVLNETLNPWGSSVWQHDLAASYTFAGATQVSIGIDNLSDERPYVNEWAIPVSPIGRSGWLRLAHSF